MLEFFDSRFHTSTGGPDIVKKEISVGGVNADVWVDLISSFGLRETGGAISADLGGVIGADKESLSLEVAEFSKMFDNEKSMVKTTSAKMFGGGGEWYEIGVCRKWRESGV